MGKPELVKTCRELRERVEAYRRAGKSIGVVPTMGALHKGHLSLVRASREACDVTIATIFVNPKQFAPNEDLSNYPRTLEQDLALLAELDTDLVFAPRNDEMYPPGFSTLVQPPQIALALEGQSRPTHFQGVVTIVLKLLLLTDADQAFFGQKDFQQCCVICQMVNDLNVPTEIVICPIVRDDDGLALSSRNVYLNEDERRDALSLSRTLSFAQSSIEQGETDARALMAEMNQGLIDGGVGEVEYAVVVDPATLEIVESIDAPVAVLLAARVGRTRLIDNALISPPKH